AFDHNVDVTLNGIAAAVPETSGVHDRGPVDRSRSEVVRRRGHPREARRDLARDAPRADVDELQAGVGLIEDLPRVAAPCRRAGELGRQRTRRSRWRTVAR